MDRDPLEVLVKGRPFRAWKSIRVQTSLEAAAASLSLSASEPAEWTLNGIEPIQILSEGVPVFTGHLDTVSVNLRAGEHSVEATGRSLTADVVDSSVDLELSAPELHEVDVLEIALEYASRALRVPVANLLGKDRPRLEKFAPQPGESAWDAIERACRKVGVLAYPDGRGRLILSRAGDKRSSDALVQSGNVLELSATFDQTQRFHFTKVVGQGSPTDEFNGAVAFVPSAEVEDRDVRNSRQLVIIAEGLATEADCRVRAQWEASIRAARAAKVTAVVAGLRQSGGALWALNERLPVDLPAIRYRGELLVESLAFQVDKDEGSKTTIELVRPDAYQLRETLLEGQDPSGSLLNDYGWEA